MKRLCGMFCCLLAALALWRFYLAATAKIDDALILPAQIQRVEQIQIPDGDAQYFPIVQFEFEGEQHSVRLIHNLPKDGMLPIVSTTDGGPYSVSALATWQSGGREYDTEIVYCDNPDRICFARHYDLVQAEQKFYLMNVSIALGMGVFSLFWMFALGRRVNLDHYPHFRRSGKIKKPGYFAPCLLLLVAGVALAPVVYYASPLFNPHWIRVRASLASVEGSMGYFYAVTHRGLDRIPGPLMASQWSVGNLTDAYYDSSQHLIHLASLDSVGSLLALVLGLIGVLALCMALYLAEERRFVRRFIRRWLREELPSQKGTAATPAPSLTKTQKEEGAPASEPQ